MTAAQNIIRIQWHQAAGSDFSYVITDATGRTVKQGQLTYLSTAISVEDLKNGLYYLQISETGGTSGTRQFSIEDKILHLLLLSSLIASRIVSIPNGFMGSIWSMREF